jgi:hypothetical protein
MKGQWDIGQTQLALVSQLRFTPQEAELMRAVLGKDITRIETAASAREPKP